MEISEKTNSGAALFPVEATAPIARGFTCTPGASPTRSNTLRPRMGSSSMLRVVTTCPSEEVEDSINGASAVTATVVVTSPSSRLKSRRRRLSTCSSIFSRTEVLKPGPLTFILAGPQIGRLEIAELVGDHTDRLVRTGIDYNHFRIRQNGAGGIFHSPEN